MSGFVTFDYYFNLGVIENIGSVMFKMKHQKHSMVGNSTHVLQTEAHSLV